MAVARAGTAEVNVDAGSMDESAAMTAATAVAVAAMGTAMRVAVATMAAVTVGVPRGDPHLAVDGPAAVIVADHAGDIVSAAVVVTGTGAGGGEHAERHRGGKGGKKELRFHLSD